MAWNPGLTRLRDLLAKLYPTIQLSREILEQAGLRTDHIEFSAAANSNWHEILKEADRRKKVSAVVDVARQQYPERTPELTAAEQEHLGHEDSLSPSAQGDEVPGSDRRGSSVKEGAPPPTPVWGEFALEIEWDGRIRARLARMDGTPSPPAAGRVSEDPLLLENIHRALAKLREGNLDEEDLRPFGRELYAALLPGEIGALLEHAVQDVSDERFRTRRDWPLRFVVQVDPESKAFDWPLEFLYYDDKKYSGWLATGDLPVMFSRRTQIVGRHAPPPKGLPLRVLAVVSNPLGGESSEEMLREMAALVSATGGAGPDQKKLEIWMLADEEPSDLAEDIDYVGRPEWNRIDELGQDDQGWQPHVLHFVGHGKYERVSGRGWLALIRGDEVDWCSAGDLIRALRSWMPRVVVLQACEDAQSGTEAAFVSLVDDLARADIPAVVATQLPITNRSAIEFAKGFYKALLEGSDVDQAVQRGRREIYRQSRGSSPAFGAPVLFTYGPARIVDPARILSPGTG